MPTNQELIANDPEALRRVARQLVYQGNEELFFKEQLKIQTKAMTVIPFTLNPVQLPLMKIIQAQKKKIGKIRLLVGKCRQPGTSTVCAALVAHKYLLNDSVYAFTIAQDKTTVANIFKMHEFFYNGMDDELRPPEKYHTKGTELVVGERMTESRLLVGESKNMNVGTGQTIHVLHSSECSKYMYPEHINDSLIPACSDAPGTIQIFESTSHTAPGGAWFRSRCERAIAGDDEFIFYFIEWWRMPEYSIPLARGEKLKLSLEEKHLIKHYGMTLGNIKWRRGKVNAMNGDMETFLQNYPTTFDDSWRIKGAGAFPVERLTELREMCRPPLKKFSVYDGKVLEDPDGDLWVWSMPVPGKTYDIGADIGSGAAQEEGDPSTIEVVERYSLTQVAEWRGYIEPTDFADVLAAVGRFFGNAQVCPEVEGAWGGATLARLSGIYTNIYLWRRNRDRIAPQITGEYGWSMSYQSKQVLVGFCRHKIWHREIKIFSLRLWEEMRSFSRDVTPSGMQTFNAQSGHHDDLIIAYMIAIQTSDDENLMKWTEQGLDSTASKHIEMVEACYRAPALTAIQPRELRDEIGDWN